MKTIRFAVIAVFALLLLLPALFFNFTPDAVSDIDNRKLAPNPFETEGEFTDNFESYVNDRVGFRDKLIAGYTVLNDLVFGKMVHPSYRGFGYFINEKRAEEGAPSALVFQGSYMNKSGYKFLRNSFSEYTYVHDYQNVIDFPYYCNIFHPDCVIFEVAEYTLTNSYFNYEAMKAIQYNPSLSATKNTRLPVNPSEENITVKEGKALSTITWHTDAKYKYVWLDADVAYDMKAVESGYEVTVKTENLPDLSNCLLYTTPEDLFDDESGNLLPSVTAENGALLLNEEGLEPGFYIDPNTGERLFLPEYNYRGTSSFIDIDPTAPYYLATFHEGNGVTFAYNAILGAYYDKDGKYISGIYSSDEIQQGCYMFNGRRKLEVPKNAEFLRICIDDDDRPLQVLLEVAHNPSDYSALMEKATGKIYAAAPLEDKIVVNLGDSIFGNTENFTSVSNYISVKTGALVYNCGFGSGRMAAYGSKWDPVSMAAVAEYIGENDFTALKDAVEKGWSAMPGYFVNTLDMLENQIDFAYVDAITISYGTNDYWQKDAVLDNPDDPYDITTVCGALLYSIQLIQQKYPSMQILVTTPIFRVFLDEETGELLSTSNETDFGSGTLKDYAKAIQQACVEMNVPCLDLQNVSQINLNTRPYYFEEDEGVHPNAAGRRQMAALIGNALIDMLY